ncbi:MAG: hypothetical protein EB828_02760 [Nitrosopumilus sp. D6]|nr:MAG: hypothetical protein EB828_02760 [Nitrosopumilus sp. D6]
MVVTRTEDDIRNSISSFLNDNGISHELQWLEYRSGDGKIDLYLPNRRVIIEVKKPGVFSKNRLPTTIGTGSTRKKKKISALQQLESYVKNERRQEELFSTNDDEHYRWIGIITTGERWWAYEWPSITQGNQMTLLEVWQDVNTSNNENGIMYKERAVLFMELINGVQTRPIAPRELNKLFDKHLENFKKLYRKNMNKKSIYRKSTIIQQALWMEQLKAGGNPPISEIDDMFIRHTFLILISRTIAAVVSSTDNDELSGFVNWTKNGKNERDELRHIIQRYEWRGRTGDVLREIYEIYISPEQRKIYGEYYTPDWLADLICQKMINEKYIKEQILLFRQNKSVKPIIDPCCGSGTFLYYSILRIKNTTEFKNAELGRKENEFLASMVWGIDIHPVAVELARANIIRLLPNIDPEKIFIRQGDSLLTPRSEAVVLTAGSDNFIVKSPQQNMIVLPIKFVLDCQDQIDAFVTSANKDGSLPVGIGSNMDKNEIELLKEAHDGLRKIIKKEGNGIWGWYLKNQATPLQMSRDKAGIILSNPPWVHFNKIDDEERQKEINQLARSQKIWKGGKLAGSFDVAMLFVDRCRDMYLDGNEFAWVLPQSAMKSTGAWSIVRDKHKHTWWDFGWIPFPKQYATSVMLSKSGSKHKKFEKNKNKTIHSRDPWEVVSKKIQKKPLVVFPISISEYGIQEHKFTPIARKGISMPVSLIFIDSMNDVSKTTVKITAAYSSKRKDEELNQGIIPKKWIRKAITNRDMLLYYIPTQTNIVLPYIDNDWDPKRKNNEYWKTVSELYKINISNSNATPQTLEERIDYNKILTKRLKNNGIGVIYNNLGEKMHASVTTGDVLINDGVFYVPCDTEDEAFFLTTMLNADCMSEAICWTKESAKNFQSFMWSKIPFPRYDEKNNTHIKLSRLGKDAKKIISELITEEYIKSKTIERARQEARVHLIKTETGKNINKLIRKILPNYTNSG